jgi:ubiquinone/menaquinone biosynthesis C-methylase UbiE
MKKLFQLLSFICFTLLYCSCNHSDNKTVSSSDNNKKENEVPIDCPLRKQGINMNHMKPFADVEKYIEFLERKDRAIWQKPDAVISTMELKGTETIADVGAGSGYFSFRFASKLPKGKVIAIDIEPEMIRHIHHKVMSSDIENIEVVLASEDDPKVPEKVDIVFICDVLHHLKNRAKWLDKLYSEINKGTKLILIEFKEGNLPEGPPEKMKISAKEMLTLVSGAGFALIKKNTTILPYQNYFVFEKK